VKGACDHQKQNTKTLSAVDTLICTALHPFRLIAIHTSLSPTTTI